MDSYFQEGYGTDSPEWNGQNGQNGQGMDSHFQEGYDADSPQWKWTEWTKWTRNGQSFSGGIRTLLKIWFFENISGVNRSRHFWIGTTVASQFQKILRQSMLAHCFVTILFCKVKSPLVPLWNRKNVRLRRSFCKVKSTLVPLWNHNFFRLALIL